MSEPVETLLQQAAALMREGRRREAIAVYQALLARRPDLPDSWYNLGYLLKAEGRFDEALAAYGQALARGVGAPEEVHLNRAVIFADHLRRDGEAEAELKAALKCNPDYAPALLNLGNWREERGDRRGAIACYRRLLDKPDGGEDACRLEALARLAQLRPPASRDDPLLARLKAAAENAPGADSLTRANLFFSLGRACDGIGDFDAAFAAYRQANAHARRTGPAYSRRAMERLVEAMIAAFPEAAPDGKAGGEAGGKQSPSPIFICGMFRSGSTLTEQALAAHEAASPGGELNILHRLAAGLPAPFPAAAASLSEEKARALAAAYRGELVKLFPDTDRSGRFVTDKRPDNFLLIGFAKRLFPEAKIVHTTRNPLDNCLSVFFHHLDQRHAGYSSDLADIAHYYGQHRRLMAHWKRLYADSIFDFDYDAFVRAPEPNLAALLEFLGLSWDARCLEFHRLENTVKTASYWQVREPLYRAASGRWRHYAAHLRPLREALEAAGVPCPDFPPS